ncbi:hypothetical protein F4Z98_12320, partial [Candidatus Poribacteria bacterium]|nr:hypothetical protein [Candidatus Poribacteria bacterium]
MNIDLNNINHLPEAEQHKLESIRDLCHQEEYSQELVRHSRVQPLVRELNDFCMSNRVIGIHYTRANKTSIVKYGLLCRSGDEIRETFLEEHGKLFTDEEISKLKSTWDSTYCKEEASNRDFMIFFNFIITENPLHNAATEDLLNHYGGEQIPICFCQPPLFIQGGTNKKCSICKKLNQIGEPLLVRCSLDPKTVNTFTENPWGKILVSSFHVEVNPEACRIDQD